MLCSKTLFQAHSHTMNITKNLKKLFPQPHSGMLLFVNTQEEGFVVVDEDILLSGLIF